MEIGGEKERHGAIEDGFGRVNRASGRWWSGGGKARRGEWALDGRAVKMGKGGRGE
jgi:hypothetical protein